jgi:hypothetical protein
MVETDTVATADEPFDGPLVADPDSFFAMARADAPVVGAPSIAQGVTLERLVTRLPSLRPVPGQELHVIPNVACRGPIELEVAWDV